MMVGMRELPQPTRVLVSIVTKAIVVVSAVAAWSCLLLGLPVREVAVHWIQAISGPLTWAFESESMGDTAFGAMVALWCFASVVAYLIRPNPATKRLMVAAIMFWSFTGVTWVFRDAG